MLIIMIELNVTYKYLIKELIYWLKRKTDGFIKGKYESGPQTKTE